jgi:hypothetical protein
MRISNEDRSLIRIHSLSDCLLFGYQSSLVFAAVALHRSFLLHNISTEKYGNRATAGRLAHRLSPARRGARTSAAHHLVRFSELSSGNVGVIKSHLKPKNEIPNQKRTISAPVCWQREAPFACLSIKISAREWLCSLTSTSSLHRFLTTASKWKRCGSHSRYTMWKLRDAIFEPCFSRSRISR